MDTLEALKQFQIQNTRYHHNVWALGSNLVTYVLDAYAECRKGGRGEDSRIWSEDQVFIRGPHKPRPRILIFVYSNLPWIVTLNRTTDSFHPSIYIFIAVHRSMRNINPCMNIREFTSSLLHPYSPLLSPCPETLKYINRSATESIIEK
jgi:hypothetical protein